MIDPILMGKGADEFVRSRIPKPGGFVPARRQDPSTVRAKRRVFDLILMVKRGNQLAGWLGAGHEVIGLTRSKEGAKRLTAAGATPHWGRLEDLESLRRGAASADGVIHLAFLHGFSDAKLSTRLSMIAHGLTGRSLVSSFLAAMIGTDRAAIETLGSTLAGSDRPFVITVGTMGLRPGVIASEKDTPDPASPGAARSVPSEKAAAAFASKGVRTAVVRLPPSVHGDGDAGFIPRLIAIARKKRASAL